MTNPGNYAGKKQKERYDIHLGEKNQDSFKKEVWLTQAKFWISELSLISSFFSNEASKEEEKIENIHRYLRDEVGF